MEIKISKIAKMILTEKHKWEELTLHDITDWIWNYSNQDSVMLV